MAEVEIFHLTINILLATFASISTVVFYFTWRRRPDLLYWFIGLIIFTASHILLVIKHINPIFVYFGNAAQVIALLVVITPTFIEYTNLMIRRNDDNEKAKREILILIFSVSINALICAIAAILFDQYLFLDILQVIVLIMITLLLSISFFVLRIYLIQKTITKLFMFVAFLAGTITAISTITAIHSDSWGVAFNYATNFIFMTTILIGGLAAPIERRIVDSEEKYKLLSENLEELVDDRTLELERVNKELEAFSYSVSHDLKSPIRAITGFCEVLIESSSMKLNDKEKEYLNRIINSTDRMNELINDLLDLSKITFEKMSIETVNLSSMADEIMNELINFYPKHKIDFEIDRGITAKCDIKLIRIALENLFSNAIKFSATKPTSKIKFGVEEKNGNYHYFVEDNGIGFDMNYYEKLFGLFQRLHSNDEFEGTGIGLITVRRIIERHKGEIWAKSKLDEGATFYFTLG